MDTRNKKDQILDIAEKLFCNYGSKDTTVRLIAQKANINTAMLNYYFKSKENLFVMIFERRIEQFKTAEKRIDLRNKTASEELLVYINFFIDLIADHQPFYKLMMKEKLSNENEKIVTLINSYFKLNRETLKNIIKRESIYKQADHTDIETFIMTISGFLVCLIFKLESESELVNQRNKNKAKQYLEKVLVSFAVV
ncbi:TetR/AcrR family transcriptional regulator [Flavobacterium sp. ANB]|uniref:TetR/AcrR family transcriptional regulator n=1 Tax=unclassified Flavobacterium TaxID=196869 RepID=UPI00188C9074|nr:TetR/AcrR family transcriptional regulator [Flavobacterium sp. ANB]MBF4518902.1 TetR/AcrR family transcriptional regulator [Flavobacterium sp. ANB]